MQQENQNEDRKRDDLGNGTDECSESLSENITRKNVDFKENLLKAANADEYLGENMNQRTSVPNSGEQELVKHPVEQSDMVTIKYSDNETEGQKDDSALPESGTNTEDSTTQIPREKSGFLEPTDWSKHPEFHASNDASYWGTDAFPTGLMSEHQVVEASRLMLDGPLDMPARADAMLGLSASLAALEPELPSVASLLTKISELRSSFTASPAESAVVVSLSRRKGHFLHYALAIEIGSAIKNGRSLDSELLKIFGINCLRHLLSGYEPSPLAISNLRHGLLFALSKNSQSWSKGARSRALNKARNGLSLALECNQKAAEEYGLSSKLIRSELSSDPIQIFNRAYRRRVENLIDFATLDAVAAAGGYDTLSPSGLLYSGETVLNKALTGDRGAFVVGLEVVTHLTSEGVLQIPIKRGDFPPAGALAWLDVDSGIYAQVLYRIREQGAKVDPGMEPLYEVTTQVVSIHLSPPFHKLLVDMDRASGGVAENVEGLTGAVGHCSRSSVVKGAGYRITARRIQESLPTLLIQDGYHRWPVALATNSHFLVTRGRRAYGACRSESIDKVIDRVYQLLGWPRPTGTYKSELVGTPTVPKAECISQCLNYLCDRADRLSTGMDTYEGVCLALQAHAAWLAMLESLAFALRRWLVYDIKIEQVVKGDPVKFNDKDVHEHQGPGVPAVTIVSDSVMGWMRLCHQAIALLNGLADADSLDLANCLEKYLTSHGAEFGIVTVDALGVLKPIGYKTWHDILPENIRLQANFSRQFWPLKLMDHDVEQVVMDLLMRHQLDSLPPGTSRSVKSMTRSMRILRAAMEAVMFSLNLRIPHILQGDQDGH
jgi:hypothetical protein